MNSPLRNKSIVYWYPDREKHRCGYCKNEYGSISHGMWSETLTVEDYQNLIDRGWRRSGKYCYKPIMYETCCPQYTIKCDALNFSVSKSQKKVIKKFNKYLEDGILIKNVEPETQNSDRPDTSGIFIRDRPNINFSKINKSPSEVETNVSCDLSTVEPHCNKNSKTESTANDPSQNKSMSQQNNFKCTYKEGVGADLNRPPCKKAKLLRLERKKEKLLEHGLSMEKKQPVQAQKSIEDFLEDVSQSSKHKLRLELVPTSEPDIKWERVKEVEYELYRKYQMIVHNDPPSKLSMKSFHRFLVSSPLQPVDFPRGVDGPGYGSFHQQYWIDDKLIAVGVIDILPRCVSSVYFFYDPDYRNLTLGTYGSLREVQLVRSLHEKIPELSSYYMGFYIHSCQKMRYKGKLVPSFLLCPETYHWIPIEKCLDRLDASKYSRLEEDIDGVDENFPKPRDIDEILILYNYKLMHFKQYKRHLSEEQNVFTDIGLLIGKKCTKTLIFCVN
ncbi:arginyl-tRNA--protein transferase 1 isoform X2 [Anoplophora glabripennis]|uniref:arginyl-tRNA--protein transferase 1 isoform X2 n=1 Tax=Anoplophora glabripennis TaxID=217634 RepID=UPI0008742C38|nr:arginyl-tRNA--protein transferase 1 isoform X2 [Anoplophora glabripennis]